MFNKTLLVLGLIFSFNVFGIEQSIEVVVKKDTATTPQMDLLTLNGYRQAVTSELLKSNLDSEKFWQKLEEKNLSDTQEVEFLKPLFKNPVFLAGKDDPNDAFIKSIFKFDFDQEKFKAMTDEFLSDLPDVTLKTFYIVPDISIDKEMTWSDVGVSKKENFSGVIVDSWKKWAATQFKNYVNVVVLEKDFSSRPSQLNAESVTLKWNSMLKKAEVFQDRRSIRYELSAQYVLVNTKTNETLVGFDFPLQKRELGINNQKELSSNLASLIYNLLNSQTAKITQALAQNQASAALTLVEFKVTGKHGLFDITQINTILMERFKDQALTSELKSYSSEGSTIAIKSKLSSQELTQLLAREGGKYPLSEQKILSFSPETNTFAIISKEANN